MREIGDDQHVRFMIGCWAIWEGRNKKVFEGRESDARLVVRRIWEVEQELERSNEEEEKRGEGSKGRGESRQGERDSWVPTMAGRMKINVDAASKEEVGVGLGIVCRDERGMCLWGVSNRRREHLEPRIAEAVALLEGLKEARERSYRNIVMESDCCQLIEDIKSSKEGRNEYFLVLDDIRSLCNAFDSIVWSFVRRTSNFVAHLLAHYEPNVIGRRVWTFELPPPAATTLLADLRLMN
ncbi:uncharacterized protein LOC141614543 [Silene latifolia]|uniref:uncharacterized protein LOC141614543 n=1 Tax=Silene latifolia TaxID=37657 RepID=UPI003D771C6B